MDSALSDLKVIDVGHYIAGPYCASLLAGLGAEVIKVERPGNGDAARQLGPFPGDTPHPEKSGLFSYLNLGKKGITLNLKSSMGREIFLKLIRVSDILIENYEPRVMPSLKLNYEELRKINPKLVMVSISNYGQTGPYRDYKGFEITINALGGIQYEIGDPDREPLKLGGEQMQFQAGLVGAFAAMSAIWYRNLTGLGQQIDLSIAEIAAIMKGAPSTYFQFNGMKRMRNGTRPMRDGRPGEPFIKSRDPGSLYPIAILPCKDGYVCVDTEAEPQWQSFCEMIGKPELKEDARFRRGHRGEYADEVDAIISEWLIDKTQREIFEECTAWRIPVGIVNNMETLFNDPQHRERGFFSAINHSELGSIEYPGHLFLMSETPWHYQSPAPLLSEHNREIIIQQLGYSEKELSRALAEGAV
jgi:crotonobetainyl-CoA:carnitine CoA-transferase CaiB-like acyl-CoA transferase